MEGEEVREGEVGEGDVVGAMVSEQKHGRRMRVKKSKEQRAEEEDDEGEEEGARGEERSRDKGRGLERRRGRAEAEGKRGGSRSVKFTAEAEVEEGKKEREEREEKELQTAIAASVFSSSSSSSSSFTAPSSSSSSSSSSAPDNTTTTDPATGTATTTATTADAAATTGADETDPPETVFIRPPLSMRSSALSSQHLSSYLPSLPHLPRDPFLPSLDPNALSIFRGIGAHHPSSRMLALLDDMKSTLEEDPLARFVIFSQYRESLGAALVALRGAGHSAEMVVGSAASPANQIAFGRFCGVGGGMGGGRGMGIGGIGGDLRCLLLTTSVSAAGLTLTAAHTLYMLEPTHSMTDEAQAVARVHRIGQDKPVRCVVFFLRRSCEERVLALRQMQGRLTELLSGTGAGAGTGVGEAIDLTDDGG
ncbi:P-loop containing nucleoside triphosphate hydrolase protein, partial [Ochromonadaceae sp. CCMP2298]